MKGTPVDKWGYIWFLCMMLGVAQLFPWNALLTIYTWYPFKFGTFPFMFCMSIAFNWPNIIMLVILTSSLGSKIPVSLKLYGSLLLATFLLLALPSLNAWDWDQNGRIAVSLVIVFCTGLATATLIGTGFGLVASLPPSYTTALMTGQGLAGLLIGGLKLTFDFVIWKGPLTVSQNEDEGIIYFSISASIMLVCLLCTFLLQHSEFYKYYQNEASYTSIQQVGEPTTEDESTSYDLKPDGTPVTRWGVFQKIWPDALNVFLVFFVSLSLFPGFTSMMPSYSENPDFRAAFVTVLISLFQLFDAIGRMCPAFFAPEFLKRRLWIPVVARLAFFPLFILSICQIHIFTADWIPIVVMIFFAASNGYFGSCAMMWGPTRVSGAEAEVAGTMMSFFLQFGIWSAVHFAFLLKYMVTGAVINDVACNMTDIN